MAMSSMRFRNKGLTQEWRALAQTLGALPDQCRDAVVKFLPNWQFFSKGNPHSNHAHYRGANAKWQHADVDFLAAIGYSADLTNMLGASPDAVISILLRHAGSTSRPAGIAEGQCLYLGNVHCFGHVILLCENPRKLASALSRNCATSFVGRDKGTFITGKEADKELASIATQNIEDAGERAKFIAEIGGTPTFSELDEEMYDDGCIDGTKKSIKDHKRVPSWKSGTMSFMYVKDLMRALALQADVEAKVIASHAILSLSVPVSYSFPSVYGSSAAVSNTTSTRSIGPDMSLLRRKCGPTVSSGPLCSPGTLLLL